MILPSIMPDELARSYLGRICRLNGVLSPDLLRPQIEQMVASVMEKPEDCTWIDLLAAITQQTTQTFFAQHTVLPFSRAIRPARECVAHGSRRDALEDTAHFGQYRLTESAHRLCPACVREDLSFWGTSYWRRSHQLKAVAACHKHGVGLHHVKTKEWTSLPHDEVATSIPMDASIIDDAANNPVIGRYAEICSALAERKCPIPTTHIVQTIRQQMEKTNTRGDPSWSGLGAFVIEKIEGPWQRHFFSDLTGRNSASKTESLGRTQSCIRMAYATHFYALALAALFESADEAILQISRPAVTAAPRRIKACACRQEAAPLGNLRPNAMLTAAVKDFLSGASIAEACRLSGEDPRQLEALLRAVAAPLRSRIETSH